MRFEITEQTRQALGEYFRTDDKSAGELFFSRRNGRSDQLSTRQYARRLSKWISSIGLDSSRFGTHSLRRTKAVRIYRRTGNLRAVQLLLGYSKHESTVGYFDIEIDDALAIAERIEI